MDPYLEHPALWPDVHNRLIAAIADDLTPRLAPRYYIGLERRAYLLKPDDVVFIGRPDIAVIPHRPQPVPAALPLAEVDILEVDVPMNDEVGENYLEVHEVTTGKLVTILEVLSPVNKLHGEGRPQYEEKRDGVFRTRTNLVEVDLLRAGEPLPVIGKPVRSDYRILVSRGAQRPHAQLYTFNLRPPIPLFHFRSCPATTSRRSISTLSCTRCTSARGLICASTTASPLFPRWATMTRPGRVNCLVSNLITP